ncbi:unnamed protein product [Adineta steineri]|uniref:G-protein coupled receptors family 1 profile domain-containing protein n=2 Tax=Adineta steineri TaxID=433720 RepID=A0A819K4L1_9BILA|nr:unnamed protein product [Adineta steineri]CAF3941001.1 unnamed protein product [Adineta steineri]
MVILLSISIPCSICIFIYFYRQRKKTSNHQHLTLVLVILCFMDMIINFPFGMIYNRYRRVIPATSSFCLWWNWWVYSFITAFIWVTAWGSIDRHLLVFHNTLMSTQRRRFVFHTLPMVFCLLPCFAHSQPTITLYDFVMNTIIPLAIITIANVALIVRVLWQKRNQRGDWQRKWKLTTYLISIAILFMITWYPKAINNIIYMYTSSPISLSLQSKYLLFLPAILEMLLPIVSVFFLSDFKKIVFRFQQNTIIPLNFNHQTPAAKKP